MEITHKLIQIKYNSKLSYLIVSFPFNFFIVLHKKKMC